MTPLRDPVPKFLTCFGRFFGPACVRISYAFSLRSVFFATSKQRALVWAIKGPTCGMEEDHMRKVFIEDKCKMLTKVSVDDAFLPYSTADSALQHFPFLSVWNIPQ